MVDSQHIHTYLSSFIQYSEEDIEALETLVKKESFSTQANVALLKAYHQNKQTEKYEMLLPKVALMVPDRSVLKKHIEDIVIKEISKQEILPIEISTNYNENINTETEEILEKIPVEKIHEFSPEKRTEILAENIPDIEEENEHIAEEILEKIPVEKIHEFSPEKRTEILEKTIPEQEVFLDKTEKPETIVNEEILEENTDDFFSWLKQMNDGEIILETEEKAPEIITVPEPIIEEKKEEEITNKFDQSEKENPPKTQKEIDDLLNKFISTNPSISRPKITFYNPIDRAKDSEEIKEDLASETLAKIYVSQQLYDKAILVWEQLKKMKPEKAKEFQKEIETTRKMKKGK